MAIWTGMATAQTAVPSSPRVIVGSPTIISRDDSLYAHAESMIAVNPRNTQNLIAAVIVATGGHFHTVTYASFDGGHTWVRGRGPESDRPFREDWSVGDPAVRFDAAGTAFFARLVYNSANGFLADSTLFVSRSDDGGRTWEPGVTLPVIHDRPYFATDRTSGPYHGRTYLVGFGAVTRLDGTVRGGVAVGYSSAGGQTFRGWRSMPPSERWDQFGVGTPVVTPDGVLVIPYVVLDSSSVAFGHSTWNAERPARHGHIMAVTSTDGGQSFSVARLGPSYDVTGSRMQYIESGLPAIYAAVDRSPGPYHGRIYLAWSGYSGGRYSIRLAYSDDTARTWSRPVVVNDSSMVGGEPTTPAVAVNKFGVVGVTWYDRRADSTNHCYQLYFAASIDGGRTFGNVRASRHQTCPARAGNTAVGSAVFHLTLGDNRWATNVVVSSVRSKWPNGGDTQGLVTDSAGIFHAAWVGAPAGTMQLMAQQFAVAGQAIRPPATQTGHPDLSKVVTLDVTSTALHPRSHTFSMRLRLVNVGMDTVVGPFTVVLDTLWSQLTGVRVANADNGLAGQGATWSFTSPGARLPPGAKSTERQLTWTFATIPDELWSYVQVARFSVLGTTPERSRKSSPPR